MRTLPNPSSSLERYLLEINRYPLLSLEEERALAREWVEKGSLRAAHKLTTSNLRFVVKIAYEYKRYGMRLTDLIQEGNIGLIMAVKKFDPDRGVRLISYAVWWIRAQIQNFILQSWRLVKIGTTQAQRRLFYKLERTRRELALLHGGNHKVDRSMLATALNVKVSLIEEMEQRLGAQEMSLENRSQLRDGEGRSLLEVLPDEKPNQEELVSNEEYARVRKQFLDKALRQLSDREQLIIRRRRLIEDTDTLSEIGKDLGITRERVRQLEARALKKLKDYLLAGGFADLTLEATGIPLQSQAC